MRMLTYFVASSLDGFIAGPRGDISWLFHAGDYGFRKFLAGIDTVVMGRKTWLVARGFEEEPFAGKERVVFSRRKRAIPGVKVVTTNPAMFVRNLKRRRGGAIWLVGGAGIAGPLLAAGLVDRLEIFVHPVVLGSGVPLFPTPGTASRWKLETTRKWPDGLVKLAYSRR
ncbi:MAG: dihydrofolate reductase family protein [Planctomycetes bacterium]|nr:dihydrofolate reductase family protein [Planctomycetota bacterium]